jgi:hypothetical protein
VEADIPPQVVLRMWGATRAQGVHAPLPHGEGPCMDGDE